MLVFIASLLLAPRSAQTPVSAALPPEVQAIADRPNVFLTRTYSPTALPKFEDAKASLPSPVVADHPEWVQMYWKAWELAFQHLKQPVPGSGFVSNFIDPAFNSNTFQWDTCFMLEYARYAEPVFHAIGSLDNFYAKQHPDGYICREINRETGKDFVYGGIDNTINPPLFSWIEWQNYLLTGDKTRFADVLPPLVKYYGWLKKNRTRPDGTYWNTSLGAGEDDLTRGDTAYSWVDMTAQQAQNALYLSQIATVVGETSTAQYFNSELQALGALVNDKMWDKKSAFFYDLKADGSYTGIKTVLGFWPLMARIANREQVQMLAKHLQNPAEFLRSDVVPALSADEPGYTSDGQYWNGAVWAPTNMMVINGLEQYGLEDLAARLSAIYLANMSRSLRESGAIWENYAPEYAVGHGVRDMVGWSGDGPIALLIENILGIRTSAAEHKITWRPRLADQNGINNLTIGAARVSLIAQKAFFGQRDLTVTSTEPFSLRVDSGDNVYHDFKVLPGVNKFTVPCPPVFNYTYPTFAGPTGAYRAEPFDLALNCLVAASSAQSPSTSSVQAVDGKPDTEWVSTDSMPQSLKIDLGKSHLIVTIHLYWGAAYAAAYAIEGSLDGRNWSPVYRTTKAHGGVEYLPVMTKNFRYVRLTCLQADGVHKNVALREIQVIGQ